jgi:hypothetical protein
MIRLPAEPHWRGKATDREGALEKAATGVPDR